MGKAYTREFKIEAVNLSHQTDNRWVSWRTGWELVVVALAGGEANMGRTRTKRFQERENKKMAMLRSAD